MRNERDKELDQSTGAPAGRPTKAEATIEDLSPEIHEADEVRGGALPPNEVRLGITPPEGVYVLPPET